MPKNKNKKASDIDVRMAIGLGEKIIPASVFLKVTGKPL